MRSIPSPPPPGASETRSEATRQHIRGSNLLLLGRLISLFTNFAVHVLTVRYLAKADYGAFAYGLAVATTAANAILLGLPRSVSRSAPFYQEKRDYAAMYGSLVLATAVIVASGLVVIGATFLLRAPVLDRLVGDPLTISLLLVLIALAPLQALDNLLQSILAIFSNPMAIFFRRYVLGPLIKLGVVLFVITVQGSVVLLASGYVLAGVLGVAIYVPMLARSLRELGLLEHWNPRGLRLPVREVLGFGLPLALTDVLVVARPTLAIVLIEYFRGTVEVADFRAFVQFAGLNQIVMQSMKMLYLPVASRLYARGDHAGIEDLFWQSTIWIAVITFPIFAVCLVLHEPVTLLLYGDKYVAASFLVIPLALGEYGNAALGLHSYTLQVYARIRVLAASTLIATALGLALALWLIPARGAFGAAIAVSSAMIAQALINYAGLELGTEVRILRRRYWKVHASLAATALTLCAISLLRPPLFLEIALVAGAALFLLRFHRETMHLHTVFPELKRLPPALAWLVGVRRAPDSAG